MASRTGSWRLGACGILALAAVLSGFPLPAWAQTACDGMTCSIDPLPGPFPIGGQAGVTTTIPLPENPLCYPNIRLDWGDGVVDGAGYYTTTSWHHYATPGVKTVTLQIKDQYNTKVVCSGTATVTVLPCELAPVAITVTKVTDYGSSYYVVLSVASPQAYCGYNGGSSAYEYRVEMTWGDGQTSSQNLGMTLGPYSMNHYYAKPGSPPYTVTATLSATPRSVNPNLPIPEPATGSKQVDFTPPGECLTVGSLKLCADVISPPQNGDEYTMSTNARINDTLWCTGDMKFKGTPASGAGTLTTDGNLFVKLAGRGNTSVLTGPGISYQVDGNGARMTLNPDIMHTFYSFALQGVSLYTLGSSLLFTQQGLNVDPQLYIGNPLVFALASLRPTLLLPPSGTIQILSTQVVNGAIRPDYAISDPQLAYDGVSDQLGGTVAVSFPKLGTWILHSEVSAASGCLDTLLPLDPAATSVDLKVPNVFLAWPSAGMEHICAGTAGTPKFKAVLRGDAKEENLPPLYFELASSELVYQPPFDFRVRKGFLTLPGGKVSLDEDASLHPLFLQYQPSPGLLRGNGSFADKTVLDGRLTGFCLGNDGPTRRYSVGKFRGTVNISSPSCVASGPDCPTIMAELDLRSAGSYPLALRKLSLQLDSDGRVGDSHWRGQYGGLAPIANLTPDLRVVFNDYDPPQFTFFLTRKDLATPKGAARGPRGELSIEKPVAVPVQQDWVIFSATGQGAMPSIYLKTPAGETVTPATVGSFPGIHYVGSEREKTAFFQVRACPPGTWVLGEENLPESEVTLVALAPDPPPALSFGAVTRVGNTVSIQASLTPPTPESTVTLYYSLSTGGDPGGVIASGLSAASGTVQAEWDTSPFQTGTYYLVARGDNGVHLPVTAVYSSPVAVDNGGPEPPSGLAGSFSGGTAILAWTPSAAPAVSGYEVLFTDAPEVPGFTGQVPADGLSGAVLEGLDSAHNYRFAVVALDDQGRAGAPSAPWSSSICQVAAAPIGPSSAGTGQAAAFEARASSVHCTEGLAFDWDFGDGSARSFLADPTHAYAAPGTYEWTLTASSGSASAITSGIIYVSDQKTCALTCAATVPGSGRMGEAVAFTATAVPDWCLGDVAYAWDFGDGSPVGTAATESHPYSAAGAYRWTLTADIGGNRCVRAGTVSIAGGIPGDCDGSGTVSIGEVQKAINMYLGILPPGCGVDCNGSGIVSIGEVQKVINGFLGLAASC